jgi:hypothetical protein
MKRAESPRARSILPGCLLLADALEDDPFRTWSGQVAEARYPVRLEATDALALEHPRHGSVEP